MIGATGQLDVQSANRTAGLRKLCLSDLTIGDVCPSTAIIGREESVIHRYLWEHGLVRRGEMIGTSYGRREQHSLWRGPLQVRRQVQVWRYRYQWATNILRTKSRHRLRDVQSESAKVLAPDTLLRASRSYSFLLGQRKRYGNGRAPRECLGMPRTSHPSWQKEKWDVSQNRDCTTASRRASGISDWLIWSGIDSEVCMDVYSGGGPIQGWPAGKVVVHSENRLNL